MKSLWKIFSSVWLTIVTAGLICIVAAWGSLLTVANPRFFGALDRQVLFPWLLTEGVRAPGLTLWIFILVALTALFAVNTVVCTAERLRSIVRLKLPVRTFFPHIVHIGFLVALVGHLASGAWGFRSYGNVLVEGRPAPVPHTEGLSVRLEGVETSSAPSGDLEDLRTTITLLDGERELLTEDIRINGPVIYRGVAFYHTGQGATPTGLVLDVDGERVEAPLEGGFSAGGKSFTFGALWPDFALDPDGRPYSRSADFANPHVEVLSGDGSVGYLALSSPGASTRVRSGDHDFIITLEDYIITPYAVLAIHRDPGIWLIVVGSAVLVAGMVLLLLLRGERGELVRQTR
ncbi:MAG: cytochrome c biogenesis protein ResB [Thermodesulfobacteriota bacterium]